MADIAPTDDYVVDFSEVEEFVPIPTDIYFAEIFQAEFKLSRQNQVPMLSVNYVILEGEYEGRKIFGDNWMLAGGGAWRGKRNLRTLGYDVSEAFSAAELAADLIGRQCRIRTEIQPYQGEDRTRVAALMPVDSDVEAAVDAEGVPF